jgi:crotonobetainyl-CoA:carnitine CoA-transferase CaiB-like acyl-CoA transferase
MFAAHAILAALVERQRTGKGRRVDVALNDALLALHTYQAGRLFATGEVPSRDGNYHATIVPYGTFAVSDGFINVAVATDAQFQRFCEVLNAPELAGNPRFATNAKRQAARSDLNREIAQRLSDGTRQEWLDRLGERGIPAGPILDIKEAFASPLATAREMRVEIEHPRAGHISQVGAPWKLDGDSSPIRLAPPALGQHTAEVMEDWLGYDGEEIRRALG